MEDEANLAQVEDENAKTEVELEPAAHCHQAYQAANSTRALLCRTYNTDVYFRIHMKSLECGNPVVRSVIVGDQLISDRDQVDAAIPEYFQGVDGIQDHG